MKSIKKIKLKRKRKKKRGKTKNTQEKSGKVASRRTGGLLSRKEGRLTRTKDYTMIFYFLIGCVFLTVMILAVLEII